MLRRDLNRLFVIAAATFLTACGKSTPPAPPPPAVGIVTVKYQPVELTRELPGRVSAIETSEVRPQISGLIRRRLFVEGSMVKAGQVLYEIDDAPYRAAVSSARGGLQRAQASIRATSLQAERYRGLVRINAVSKQEADNADASAQQARADVATQQAAVQTAQVNLAFTRIRAPISGRIGRSLFTPGALVTSGQTGALATIQRTDQVFVDVSQSAAQMLDLKEALRAGGLTTGAASARVQLLLPNGKVYPIEGRLQFSEVSVDPATGAVTLRATFANAEGLLMPGLYVRAKLVEGVRQQAMLVAQQGIARDPRGRATAMIVNANNKVELRNVTTDRAIGDKWVITGGLKPGDRVIVEGLLNLAPGTTVQPTVYQQPAAAKSGN